MNKYKTISNPIIIKSDSDVSDRMDAVLHINIFLPNKNIEFISGIWAFNIQKRV